MSTKNNMATSHAKGISKVEFLNNVKFDSQGLVPVITQDCPTGKVVMLAYANREALSKTLETGLVHYWSRSRNELWLKGSTSGHYQKVKEIYLDCDSDAVLMKIEQQGNACHTGEFSCFYTTICDLGAAHGKNDDVVRSIDADINEEKTCCSADILFELMDVIKDRKINPKENSYTNYLFTKGLDKILKKVGEETAEVIIASKNLSKDEMRYEIADLIYHLFVLMVERGMELEDIFEELRKRR